MRVSKNWLKDYLDISKYSDEELYDIFTSHVCEIETMKKMCDATNLTVGLVKTCVAHPDSDHLHVCEVEVRPGEVLQIVCGAPNVKAGVKVIVANIGAVLPGNFKIKKSTIRGVESNGMLCSLQELGIEEKYVPEEFKNGIYLLPSDVEVGSDPLKYLGIDDTVIDLEVTSNRSDLLSIEGVAFDLGAAIAQKVTPKNNTPKEVSAKNPVEVSIETDGCHKYLARYIKNVKISESPMWLKSRLVASGIRPINNVVDITNLVLMEMGQPLHSFDGDKLGNKIVVRNAKAGEKFVTLDEIERTLEENDIVITDGVKPVCLGGVMGGLNTEIDDNSKTVILEAAYFEPLMVRKTSSRLNLKSESSVRFERKIDYNRVERALDYAAYLIQELAGGEVYSGVAKAVRKEYEKKYIDVTAEKINRVLGTSLEVSYIENIFDRLNYTYEKQGDVYHIEIPSRRMDLEPSPQDVIEDVARMYGYENIPTTLAATRDKGGLTVVQKKERMIREILSYSGLNEVISYSLISEDALGYYVKEVLNPIKVMMPLTEDKSVMRQSLLNGVVDAIAYNKARKIENLAFYEVGKVYSEGREERHLAIALNGLFSSHLWNGVKQVASFYLLKGLFDALLAKLGLEVGYQKSTDYANFHPGRTASIIFHGHEVGVIGELHPKFTKAHDVAGTIVLEVNIEEILTDNKKMKYHSVNKFPAIERDIAIVVENAISAQMLEAAIKKASNKTLSSIEVFDLYHGENLGANLKSIAFRLTFEDYTRTLETKEVDEQINHILEKLTKDFGAKLR